MLNSVKAHGILGLVEHLIQRRHLWSIEKETIPVAGNSSVSDEISYLQIIKEASSNDESFSKFRRNREYRQILEHVSKNQGKQYLGEIKTNRKELSGQLDRIKFLNTCGSPLVYFYSRLGLLSPTTLRYFKVYEDLIGMFPKLSQLNIAEIGGGFGGQAAVLRQLAGFNSYTIYDLPEVLKLQSKFLHTNSSSDDVLYADGREAPNGKFDLVISNYALSELVPNLQRIYFENVVQLAPSGYLTWNLISEKRLGGLSIEDVIEYLPNPTVIEETPLTDHGNVLITWGTSQG